jgi:hypothetical protein
MVGVVLDALFQAASAQSRKAAALESALVAEAAAAGGADRSPARTPSKVSRLQAELEAARVRRGT